MLGGVGCLVCCGSHDVLDWTIDIEGFGSVLVRFWKVYEGQDWDMAVSHL